MFKNFKTYPRRIVILGPQGSGKGTQAAIVAKRLRLSHISTGDIFRLHLKHRTSLGRKIARLLEAGRLVPDALTNRLVAERLRAPDCRRGYVFDGYPRTLAQARFLQTIRPPEAVCVLELSDAEAVGRLSGRRMAPDGTIYHLRFNPPPARLRQTLILRDDDRPRAVRERLRVYRKQTGPLLRFYRRLGLVRRINARPKIPVVTSLILAALKLPIRA